MPIKKVICIGSATKDVFLKLDETFLLDNPTNDPTVQKLMCFEFGAKTYVKDYKETVGGSAVNVGVGLKNLGILPFIFSRVPRNSVGTWITKKIGKYKLKKNYIQQNGGAESQVSTIISDLKNKGHIILRAGDSVDNFNTKKALDKFRERADFVYIGSQKTNWETNFIATINFCTSRKIKLICNPSSYQITKDPVLFASYLRNMFTLILNKDEAIELVIALSDKKSSLKIDNLFKELFKTGVKNIIITDGENGVFGSQGLEIFYLPGTKKTVIDTVGAGDSFASGFIAGIAKEEDFSKALVWGMANSRSVVTKPGSTQGLLAEGEMQRSVEKITKELQILK